MEKTPTIEDQINQTISVAMRVAHEDQKQMIQETIQLTVNGKIDAFRADQKMVNESQNRALEEIRASVKDVIQLYNGSNNFFRTTKTIAGWVMTVSGGIVAVWAFIKFVVLSAIKQ